MPVHKKILLVLIIVMVIFVGTPTATQEQDTLLRLHVKANSDSPEDQALKYQVRDTVLEVLNDCLKQAGSAQAAQQKVAHILPEVITAAQETVSAAGFHYTVTASLGCADFPTRMYGDQIYRAGSYQALQIYLGEGEGQNWWCVLFPPLCFVESRTQSSTETVTVASMPQTDSSVPRFKSRLFIWWQRLFGKK